MKKPAGSQPGGGQGNEDHLGDDLKRTLILKSCTVNIL